MKRRWWIAVLPLLVLAVAYYSGRATAEPGGAMPAKAEVNQRRIQNLVDEMRRVDVDRLAALAMKPLEIPEPGVDVMRVRLEETYDIEGVGKDTVELKGWIAVKHDNTRPAEGEELLTWNSAVTDTEFVAMELRGESAVFGPVEISLDKSRPSVGQVGKLCFPFAVGSSLDASYMPHRTLFEIDRQAAGRAQSATVMPAAQRRPGKPRETSTLVKGEKARPVVAVVDGVIKAIGAKDPKAMMRYYSSSGSNLFFGQTPQGVTRGGEDYVRQLSRTFENIKSIEIKRNDDVQVRMSDNLAVATLTGVNNVVNAKGQRGSSPWRWTVEMERTGNQWQITHDHLSFYEDPGMPIDRQQISGLAERGACCLANISVAVNMSKLGLKMWTAEPVRWYSEVETIPPVGYTASVSATPTPLVAAGRQVGTLEHGVVKFREVVRHVSLLDSTRPDLRIASIRVPPPAGR